ncbi:MAG TPA: aminoglycoside phosphotransferase family protein [Anaerolineae bacterium]|nr:aminoglycoside phosphotransferase family protein [Anaerolineae bacterium]HQI85990.1 aminoglycoside phosphotransferase family protein [Anaerolineae bacterium]
MIPLLPVVTTWAEWGRMFTNVAQWTSAVREICRRHNLPAQHVEAGYPGTNAVFVVDDAYVVKIYAPFCPEDFDLECELYALLSRDAHIPVPSLIAQGVLEDQIRWPYIIIDFKPGAPIREVRAHIPRRNLLWIAADMGEIVRHLHHVPVAQLTSLDHTQAGWREFVRRRAVETADAGQWADILPPSVVAEIPGFLASALDGDDNVPLVLMNGDLTEDHILLRQDNGKWRISGLIDFGDALVGQREYEWIALWFSGLNRDYECLTAFMDSYDPHIKLDDDFFTRAMAFTFLHEFAVDIMALTMKALGHPAITSLQELQALVWQG